MAFVYRSFQFLLISVFLFFLIAYSPTFLDVDPQPFSSTKAQQIEDSLVQNRLGHVEKRLFDEIIGPESFAVYKGKIYTGLGDGRIIAIKGNKYENISVPKTRCAGPWEQEVCGRPLGLRFTSDGTLYVADTFKGLLKINIKTGSSEVLVKANTLVDDLPLKFLDDISIDEKSNVIYMSDASTKWTLKKMIYGFFETKPTGRVLKYDMKTKVVSTVASGFYFTNGVQLSHDGKSLLISDSTTTCIKRYHLHGSKKGELDDFICGLPGFPDNIRPSKRKGYWVALGVSKGTKSTSFLEKVLNVPPLARKVLLRVMDRIGVSIDFISQNLIESISWKQFAFAFSSQMYPFIMSCEKYGSIVELDEYGKIIKVLHAPNGEMQFISEVLEHDDGNLYLGTFLHNFLGVIPKD